MGHNPMVPSAIVKKYIAMWMAEDPDRTYDLVFERTGINVRTIHDVMRDKRATVRFDTADQILVALGYGLAWYRDAELSEYYAAA